MKIIFDDIIYSLQKSGGGSVYWTEVTKRIRNDSFHYAYDNANSNIFYNEENFANNKKWSSRFLILKRYLNLIFNEKESFIFHSSLYRFCWNKNAKNITTVHDFTYEYFRKDIKSLLHKKQKKNAVMHSDGVICISENTKKDLLKFYPNYKGKLKVIYNGYDDENFFYEKNKVKNKNILFVGARNDYKRFDFAIDIVSALKDYKLVIIGGGDLTPAENEELVLKIPNRFEKMKYVSNDDLRHLYNEAFCLCYPSEYEGFGIPLIEAQACGCPVICQPKSCIPEVVLDSALFIDSSNFPATIESVKQLEQTEFYNNLVSKGLENSKRFSWTKCSKEVEAFYSEVFHDA